MQRCRWADIRATPGSRFSATSQWCLVSREHLGAARRDLRSRPDFMALFVWFLVGSIVGWLSTLLVRDQEQRRISRSVYAGVAGAFVGGLAWGLFVNADVSISSLGAS